MNTSSDPHSFPIEIDVASVDQCRKSQEEDVVLLDCREPFEFEHCRIDGAKFIPMNETPARIDELTEFKEKRIVVYCHAGVRSFQVASWLRSQGFEKAQSMQGGIDAWSQLIDPSVPRY